MEKAVIQNLKLDPTIYHTMDPTIACNMLI